ncbi:MAG: hypothetical protein JO285_02515 [Kutzneria sp.]|nr:hypothetical protein [Kutzneria sp.]
MTAAVSLPATTVEADNSALTEMSASSRLASLADVMAEIGSKRAAEVIRFRTCCADPRASK